MKIVPIDFETYSAVGHYFDPLTDKWVVLPPTNRRGLKSSGAYTYAEHPSSDVICLAYDMKNGQGINIWRPYENDEPPWDLIDHVKNGGCVSGWNVFFELCIWNLLLHKRAPKIWPFLGLHQVYCTQARGLSVGLPPALGMAAEALNLDVLKDKKGKSLITKFSIPRHPTLKYPNTRNDPRDFPEEAHLFYEYCKKDVEVESEISEKIPYLRKEDRELFLVDLAINWKGAHVDRKASERLPEFIDFETDLYNERLKKITDGRVEKASQGQKIIEELALCDIKTDSIDKDHIAELLGREDLPPVAREILDIRKLLGSSSVKKSHAILRSVSSVDRLHGIHQFRGASRTGRWSGRLVQAQNLTKDGGVIYQCDCGFRRVAYVCSNCGKQAIKKKWNPDAAIQSLKWFKSSASPSQIREVTGPLLKTISGSLRSLFSAAPGHQLYCSDYRAIEAVVLAELAQESWRQEVFRTHGKIYEMSASKIKGVPFEEFIEYKKRTGEHHPDRNSIGKVAELASGYGGGIGAWKNFGADRFLSDEEIKVSIKKWRDESPNIRNFWYGLDRAAKNAMRMPGYEYEYNGIRYVVREGNLHCILLSGRHLVYRGANLIDSVTPWGSPTKKITYYGLEEGRWKTLDTYYGKLTENVVQAVSADILGHALMNLHKAGWNTVFHVHDEIICEERIDAEKRIEDMEEIMSDMPLWAKGWPVIAHGGWIDTNYKKD